MLFYQQRTLFVGNFMHLKLPLLSKKFSTMFILFLQNVFLKYSISNYFFLILYSK